MPNKNRIRSLSTAMMFVCTAVIVAIPAWLIWYWSTFSKQLPIIQARYPDTLFSMENIGAAQLILAAAISLISATVLIFALWHLRQLFAQFRAGNLFHPESTRHLYLFGVGLFLSAIIKPFVGMALSVVLTWGNPAGQRSLILEFGSQEIAQLLIAGTFMIITWVFCEGQRISQENAEFV